MRERGQGRTGSGAPRWQGVRRKGDGKRRTAPSSGAGLMPAPPPPLCSGRLPLRNNLRFPPPFRLTPCESLHSRLCTPARFLSPAGDRAGKDEKNFKFIWGLRCGGIGLFLVERAGKWDCLLFYAWGCLDLWGDINYNLKTKCSMQIRTGPYGNRKGFEADF